MTPLEQAEHSITKKYRKQIWRPFLAGIHEYDLIAPGDRIAVCISGGKDSMLMAKCLQLLQRYSDFPFELHYVVMDPGYAEVNRARIEDNATFLNLPIEVFDAPIFNYVAKLDKNPCYLCARMRRGYLYRHAQDAGCNKIALGHHFDDVVETVLMSLFYNGEFRTMMPKLNSTNWQGMQLIRPMYRVKEADIVAWRRHNDLQFIQCACRLTENCALGDEGMGSKRHETKALIKKLRQTNPDVDAHIFRSIHDVNLDTIIGYHGGNRDAASGDEE